MQKLNEIICVYFRNKNLPTKHKQTWKVSRSRTNNYFLLEFLFNDESFIYREENVQVCRFMKIQAVK